MVDAIMSFVVGKVGNYLIEEASMLMGIKDELEELKAELMCIQGYLKDVEAREKEDEASKMWTKLVLDIAYDVEDVLDSYYLKAEERSQRRGMRRLTNKIGKKMDAYNIIDDIKLLQRRILDVTRKRETYGIGNFNETRAGENTSGLRVRQLRRARSIVQEERVVGLEDDFKILLAKLLNDDGDHNRYMISIFGMGGLGKTALARKLYNSEDVKRKFHQYRAWTYGSQEYDIRDMLMRIIRSLGVTHGEETEKIRMLAEEDLEVYLYGLLKGKKYLVVVDDIWEREAWESLKRALPGNHNGSRVIITTRIRAVAEGVDQRVYAHKLRFLTFEESWNLFEQKAFRDIRPVNQDLERIGKEMVTKCGGLPLAIVVLAGLMSRKRPNEWNDVYDSLWRRLKDDSIQFSTVFDLSFMELKHELKLCFLYLSVFPEDYEIDVEELVRLLVAEGFIQDDEEMEDVARYYIEELIDRSLLETVRTERGKVMSCRIHDLLRDVAVEKAKDLNFVNVYKEQHSSTTCRREVVHHLKNKEYLCDRRVNKGMRSFLFFGEGMLDNYVDTITLKLKLLRVLNLGGIHFFCNGESQSRLPDEIGGLIHLRYLGIADTSIWNIPEFISNLHFLQTLDASGNSNYFQGRTDLRNLTSLRHVIGRFVGELLIGDAVDLQTLRTISSYSWSKLTKHELLKNLRDLEIYDYSRVVDQKRAPLDFSSFSKLPKLRVLKLEVKNFKLLSESEEAVGFMDVIFPSLECLTLVGSNIKEDLMPAFQKFPRLEDLVFKNCDYLGGKMNISAQGFGRLRKLDLIMVRLDELRIEEGAMPNLMELDVQNQDMPLAKAACARLFNIMKVYVEKTIRREKKRGLAMENRAEKRRIVLVPFPSQGHITPMMQLGQTLNLKGFSITVAVGESNQVSSPKDFPDFQFFIIPESVPVTQLQRFGPVDFLKNLNKTSEASFRECIAQLLMQQRNDITCIIYDELMYFSEAAAKEFKIPSVRFSTVSGTNHVCGCVLGKVNAEKFLVDINDPEVQEKVVENLHPLRYKHLPISGMGPLEPFLELCREIFSKRTSCALIINTASCLESSSLSWLQQELRIPVFPLGPLHITAPAVESSLMEEDMSCIEWLNKQKPRSVIYISFGSKAHMETKEVSEIAWGLYDSNQPFLWVIRAGSESLPEEVSNMVSERGYIVKWAPQNEVLAHPAVGSFWSHCGWNSTLESIVEGVPMICRPFGGEQKINALYIESVWKIGIQIEGEVERGVVERAVKRLLVDEEGACMRERAHVLKEKLKASVRSGGCSYNALDELVKYLETE
ncbi:unnamed protein product [Microthlaspi erraticum]|uniref:NB-ARC domain-containing protein n=1 Tax=Microthlaspi erraticum TaxID=1685480 RepID=A0A6D2JCA7_9BRAS|nr:unnamed protein product [Microthlaspi erraticum]